MRSRQSLKCLCLLAAISVSLTAAANAQSILHDSSTDAFNYSSSASEVNPNELYASLSADANSYAFTSVVVGIRNYTPDLTIFTFGLYADNCTTSGSLLETLLTEPEYTLPNYAPQFMPGNNFDLASNTRYWIGVTGLTLNAGWA